MARSLSTRWSAPKLSEEGGAGLPNLTLTHKGQIKSRCWGGFKKQYVHYTDEAIPGQARGLFGGKREAKCTIWKVLIAPGMNSNSFYYPVEKLVWSQNRTTRNLISSAASMPSTSVNFVHLSVHFFCFNIKTLSNYSIQFRDFCLKRHFAMITPPTTTHAHISMKFCKIIQVI